jgi:hypothetical protein
MVGGDCSLEPRAAEIKIDEFGFWKSFMDLENILIEALPTGDQRKAMYFLWAEKLEYSLNLEICPILWPTFADLDLL